MNYGIKSVARFVMLIIYKSNRSSLLCPSWNYVYVSGAPPSLSLPLKVQTSTKDQCPQETSARVSLKRYTHSFSLANNFPASLTEILGNMPLRDSSYCLWPQLGKALGKAKADLLELLRILMGIPSSHSWAGFVHRRARQMMPKGLVAPFTELQWLVGS